MKTQNSSDFKLFFLNPVIHDLQEIKHKDTEKLKVMKTNQMRLTLY